MYELVQVGETSYYINCPAKIGLVKPDRASAAVYLIDSGNDKEAGRKVRQILDKNGWQLAAIFNTHSNADHIGGNQYLQKQTHCPIYARGIEADFTRHPLLEPSFLYGGFPPQALRHKFLMAQESQAELLTEAVLPPGMELIPLPGHFFDMVGFRTADQVVYLADCLSSEETLNKYQISFVYDVAAYLNTLEQVKTMEARLFVPAHAAATEEIASLAQLNINQVYKIAQRLLESCREPLGSDQVLQQLFNDLGLVMNFDQYVLVGSSVRSYLAWLADSGELTCFFDQNRLLWQTR